MNPSRKEFENFGLTELEFDEIRTWSLFTQKIKKFTNNCRLDTFQNIFGNSDGDRLFQHFRESCYNDFYKFRTYLTKDQYNKILAYIVKIEL